MTQGHEALDELRRRHPAWEIWRVDRYTGGPLWCARPSGRARPVLNACDPADLSAGIEERDAGRPHAAQPAPYEEAACRMRAVAAGLAARGMATYLHDSRERLDLTASFCAPGERETEIVLDEDGYAEIRYWIRADAEPDEITALALRVLAAVGTAPQTDPAPPAGSTGGDVPLGSHGPSGGGGAGLPG